MSNKPTLAFGGFILSSYLAVSSLASLLEVTIYEHHTPSVDPGGFIEGVVIVSLFILCVFLFLADYRRPSSATKSKIGFIVLLVYVLSRLVGPIFTPQISIKILSTATFLGAYCVAMLIMLYRNIGDDDRETAIYKDG